MTAHFADGSTESFDVLVGADGANSAVRRQRTPALAYADVGVTGLAGVVPIDAATQQLRDLTKHGLVRACGADGYTFMCFQYRAGAPPALRHNMLWSLSHPGAQGDWEHVFAGPGETVDDEHDFVPGKARQELIDAYSSRLRARFAPCFVDLLAATPPAELFGPRQTRSLPLAGVRAQAATRPTRVHLLGDAAHATTTHMGCVFAMQCGHRCCQQCAVRPGPS